ncbi:hypothetical protein [Xenorhabdus bovienii]|uniref:hypothetical protein n=1 Tax=Xenorhabdus bovienii TaxID=40576 RepID=UPI003DA4BE91
MSEATFIFRIDNALKSDFSAAAKTLDHTGAQHCVISCAISFVSNKKKLPMTRGAKNRRKLALMMPMRAI